MWMQLKWFKFEFICESFQHWDQNMFYKNTTFLNQFSSKSYGKWNDWQANLPVIRSCKNYKKKSGKMWSIGIDVCCYLRHLSSCYFISDSDPLLYSKLHCLQPYITFTLSPWLIATSTVLSDTVYLTQVCQLFVGEPSLKDKFRFEFHAEIGVILLNRYGTKLISFQHLSVNPQNKI
jgi:hypothetical protein